VSGYGRVRRYGEPYIKRMNNIAHLTTIKKKREGGYLTYDWGSQQTLSSQFNTDSGKIRFEENLVLIDLIPLHCEREDSIGEVANAFLDMFYPP